MRPTLLPGDVVLVDPRAYRARPPERGEIVAARDPDGSGRWLVKAVASVQRTATGAPSAFLLGTNAAASRDSRRFGAVPLDRLVGVVWYRLSPRERRGPVGRLPEGALDPPGEQAGRTDEA